VSHVSRSIAVLVRATRARALALVWLAVFVAAGCGAGGGDADSRRQRTGTAVAAASADDSLAARAVSANAREQGTAPAARDVAPPSSARGATGFGPSIGFRSRQRLDDHFDKHGGEFGAITRADYLRQAQQLRDAPVGGDILELRRGDGTIARFDRASGAFLAFDEDGIIRTYFRPNDGERYFRRQGRRRGGS
jgi:hypothetical protein